MHAEHNNTMKMTSDTVLRKIYLSLYLKGLCVRGSWRPNRTATYWPRLLWPSVLCGCWLLSLPQLVSKLSGLQTGLSPTGPVSKLTDFLSSPSYIIVQRPPSCGRHNFALIQPVHGQGYNILIIPRPDAPVIYIGAFPILTAQPGRRSIYNTNE